MKLHPLLQAVIRVVPDFRYIFDVRFNMGRSKVSWVYGRTKFGTVSQFVSRKKLTQYFWKSEDTVINLKDRKQYITTLDSCTCPAFKWGKTRHCKHMDMLQERLHDSVKKRNPQFNVIRLDERKAPKGISIIHAAEHPSDLTFEIFYHNQSIGYIEESNIFSAWTNNGTYHNFDQQEDAFNYLLKQHELSTERDLFGDDMYPELEPEPFTEREFARKKRWLGLNDLSRDEKEVNLLGDYGNWLEPDPAWGIN